jgi:hypothetical protein
MSKPGYIIGKDSAANANKRQRGAIVLQLNLFV